MFKDKRINDTVHWYINELGARVVAESGHASDCHHLGKLILQGLKDAPDFISQIDGATKKSETNSSVLRRSIRCATAMKNMGLKCGDTIILMAPNHLDLAIPYYAALYLGVVAAPIDWTLTVNELESTFDTVRPKIVFCQSEKVSDVRTALHRLHSTAEIITFDIDDHLSCSFNKFLNKFADHIAVEDFSFKRFLDKYSGKAVEDFRATDFDPNETLAMLIPTSGTTGVSKSAAVSHKNFAITLVYLWAKHCNFPTPTRLVMVGSPLQWLSAVVHFVLSPILRYTRLQSSLPFTPDHMIHLINTYKPTYTLCSPPMITSLVKHHNRNDCDMTCFETILLGGSAVSQHLLDELKELAPETVILNTYGMTELTCLAFLSNNSPQASVGKPLGCYEYKIVDVETNEDITGKPNAPGELWMRGPGIFKGYYNNERATEETFSEDWFRTGDMFYRDEQWNFFFVARIKLLLKYKNHQVAPVELEEVIRQHPGVSDVAVVGIPHDEFGELPCACVMPREGHDVTEQEIKDLVKSNLSESKQLAGGVVFLKELPMTSSTKIHRRKLKEIVSDMEYLSICN